MKPINKVKFSSESDIDQGIKNGRFCRINQFSDSIEGEREAERYAAEQNRLIADLERRMSEKYGERVFVSDNIWLAELLKIEVGSYEIGKDFLVVIFDFLKEWRSLNCVNVVISAGNLHDADSSYLGRILISGRGITIEASLKGLVKERLGIVPLIGGDI